VSLAFWRTLAAAYLASVQVQDGRTPLIWAASGGHAECMQLLVEYAPKVMYHMMTADLRLIEQCYILANACAVACFCFQRVLIP